MPHIALLGDSVFDNQSYTDAEPDVVTHLRAILPAAWSATLLAVDGATTRSLPPPVSKVPRDTTHLVVSIGGNDALGNIDLLDAPARSTADALTLFGARAGAFEIHYRSAIRAVRALNLPMVVCTIYNGDLPDRRQAALARVALMMFNDAILRTAFEHRASVIDLRPMCAEPADYANLIEPSGRGGLKIAQAVTQATGAEAGCDGTRVYC